MNLPSGLYDWLYPEIPQDLNLRRTLEHFPKSLRLVPAGLERARYNGSPPQYSRQWFTNKILAPIYLPIDVIYDLVEWFRYGA